MKKIGIILISILLLCGCEKETPEYIKLMEQHDYVILDVRTPEEYQSEHIKDAQNVPYDTIDESLDIPKEKWLFVYCKSGNRSKIATESLKKLGYQVYDLGAMSKIELPLETN